MQRGHQTEEPASQQGTTANKTAMATATAVSI